MTSALRDRPATAILLAPALIVYSVVMLAPMLWSLGLTFFEGNPVFGFQFAGLDNFAQLLSDPRVLRATGFTVLFAVLVTVGQVVLGYFLAVAYVFILRNGSALIRTLLFFPVVLPTVAVGLLFKQLFQVAPTYGVVNSVLDSIGVQPIDFLNTPGWAIFVLVLAELWRSIGFYAVLLYAGIVDIPEDVIESARIDGASGIKLLRHIVVPLSAPVVLAAAIFSINGTLKAFDIIVALTNGGPAFATTPLTLYMYDTSFQYGEYGFGSTLAFVLTLLCLAVTVAIFRGQRQDITK